MIALLIEYALIAGFGVLIAVCGFLAWKKNLLWMVVNPYFNKVSSDSISPYCREQGIGMIVVGISIILLQESTISQIPHGEFLFLWLESLRLA